MTIKVRVNNQLNPGNPWEVTLPEPLATIGRQATCSVALPDPEKHVSRIHASIEAKNGNYFLVVNSRVNPVLVDGEAAVPGENIPLRHGSQLTMYPFDLAVEITPGPAQAPAPQLPPAFNGFATPAASANTPMTAAPAAPSPAPSSDPFAWLDDLSGGKPAEDPFGLGVQKNTPPPPPPPPADIFRQKAAAPAGTGLMAGLPPSQAPGPLGFGGDMELGAGPSLAHGAASLDPLALLGGGASSSGLGSLLSPAAPAPQGGNVDAFLGMNLGPSAQPPQGGLVDFGHHAHEGSSHLDHVHDFNLPFHPPMPESPPPASPPPAAPFVPPQEAPLASPPTAAIVPPSPPQPVAAPITPAASPRPAAPVETSADLAAFMQGLGATGFTIAPENAPAFFQQAGEIVRTSIQSLIALLLARGEIKKELRTADRTMLAAHNNNPLKFMSGPDEAVRFLFDPASSSNKAFLPPAQAIEDAGDELLAHEMALVAGMRAAVEGAIRRFDPAIQEQAAARAGGLVLNKKARLWELYVEQYDRMQREMADNLDRLFETEFQAAYSDQVARMKKR